MSDPIVAEEQKTPADNPTGVITRTDDGLAARPMHGKGWLKGALGMVICCAAPLLVFSAIAFFGLSLGANRQRGTDSARDTGLSDRHVPDDAHDDEKQKLITNQIHRRKP